MRLMVQKLIDAYGTSFFDILNLIPKAVGILDLTGMVVFVNKTFEKENAHASDFFVGKTVFDFYHRHDYKTRIQEYFHQMVTGNVQPELYVDKVDGLKDTRNVAISWERIEIDGELVGFIYTSDNHSPRAALENRMEEKEKTLDLQKEIVEKLRKKMQLALEGANEGVWEWDLKSDEVQYDNRYFEMLGFKRENLKTVDNIWGYLIHPDDIQRYNDGFSKFVNDKTSKYEFKYRLKN